MKVSLKKGFHYHRTSFSCLTSNFESTLFLWKNKQNKLKKNNNALNKTFNLSIEKSLKSIILMP